MILWEAREDGLWIFENGRHVGTIPRDQVPGLILSAVKVLKQ